MRTHLVVAALALSASPVLAQNLLFDNGTFVTHPGAGPDGTDNSVTETGTAISLGNDPTTANGALMIAESFTATAAWQLSELYFYEVQSQVASNLHTDFRFPAAFVQIFDADPRLGGVVIAGDLTTNRLRGGMWTRCWRLSSSGAASNTRPIFQVEIDMTWAPVLQPGTYWVGVSVEGEPGVTSAPGSIPLAQRAGQDSAQLFQGNWVSVPRDFPFKLFGQEASSCGPQDFNGDGDSGTDQDIEAFFACLGGTCCDTCWHNGADFNGDGDTGTDQDIEAFFRVLGGGTC
ncbi:MAG TPA: hypothetical protein VD997_07065 [Phycisphaerales bacterium]|nr:hypothetical protein [Phycisphaerales bacterium]